MYWRNFIQSRLEQQKFGSKSKVSNLELVKPYMNAILCNCDMSKLYS